MVLAALFVGGLLVENLLPAIIACALAGDKQVHEDAAGQAKRRAEQHRAEEYRTAVGPGERRIKNKRSGPTKNDEEAEDDTDKAAGHHRFAVLNGAQPEDKKKRYGQGKQCAKEISNEDGISYIYHKCRHTNLSLLKAKS